MKRSFIILILVLLACPAFAEVQSFSKFTLDIPHNWSAQENNLSVIAVRNDGLASLTITITPRDNTSLKDKAYELSELFNGTSPTTDSSGNYTFTFNNGESNTLLAATKEEYIFFVMSGIKTAQNEIIAILSSLKDK